MKARTMAATGMLALFAGAGAAAADAVYPATAPGKIEIKRLPALTALDTATTNAYFGEENVLFRRLFRYISEHDVAMTTPVEADLRPGRMRFFQGPAARSALTNAGPVSVERMPERTVASIGVRGSYTSEHYEEALKELRGWLDGRKDWAVDGPPRAAFWNSPFMPGFLKRFEVHVPVRPAAAPSR